MKKTELLPSGNSETSTISRAEYEKLAAQNQVLEQRLAAANAQSEAKLHELTQQLDATTQQLNAKVQELAAALLQNGWLLERLKLSGKKLFGRSSEQLEEAVAEQLSFFFNEAEALDAKSFVDAPAAETPVQAHTRKRRSGSLENIIPEGLPVETVEHRLPEAEQVCPVCGTKLVEIGRDIHRSLVIVPPQYSVREDVYYTYACKACQVETDEALIIKTPHEPTVLPGSFASPAAIAHIMTQKFVMYSPLYRQEQELNRAGLKLSRQTMSNWVLHASDDWLRPIYDVLHERLRSQNVLHADETTLQVLRETGKSAASKSYMWLYRTSGDAEHPIVLYEYQPNRKAENAQRFLDGFTGWLHADGYAGYHTLPERIRVVGCWAHARRKFDEALNVLSKEARPGSAAAVGAGYCTRLFRLEQTLAELSPEERKKKRAEQAKPILDELLAWAQDMTRKTAPKSAFGKALHYLLEQWPYLVRYLEDGRLELSNNRAERSIKPFVMGRKNFLFANTPAGAQSSAVTYSLIETAKETGLDPYRYLLWVFQQAPALAVKDSAWAASLLPEHAPAACRAKG